MSTRRKRKTSYKTQRSKLLASWAQAIWASIAYGALFSHIFCNLNEIASNGIVAVLMSATTLTGITITAYMGNSGIEKYANSKVQIEALMTKENNSQGDG